MANILSTAALAALASALGKRLRIVAMGIA